MKKILLSLILTLSISYSFATNVSGGIFSNTTWTTANSPYIVTDTVVVFPGVTLTIQPGVVVEFANNMEIEIRQAQLIAIGTAVNPITFASTSSSPTVGIYSGIYLNGGSMTCKFTYCNFSYANTGIYSWLADSLLLNNCNFNYNNTGVKSGGNGGGGTSGNSGGNTVVNACNFNNNVNYGLTCNFLDYSKITNCNFTYNGTGLNSGYYHSTTTNCVFSYNQTGLSTEYMNLSNCTITHNQTGISSESENKYRNSTIDSNTVTGISANGDSVINCQINYNGIGVQSAVSVIIGNTIEYNTTENINDYTFSPGQGWGGSVITGNTIKYSAVGINNITESFTITMNIIENNGIGIVLSNSSSTISCNKICNNNTYGLQYEASGNISAAHNYWCTTDSLNTQTLIYDGHQNISYGLVGFMPIDTVPCTSLPVSCSLSLTASATANTVCSSGGSTTLMAHVTDPSSYTIKWTPGNYTGANYTVSPTTDVTYKVVVTDSKGCKDSTTVTIDTVTCAHSCSISLAPSATNTTMSSCTSTTLYANATDSSGTISSITWNPGNYSGSSYTVSPATSTIYYVTVTDNHGCTNTANISITVIGSLATPSICYVTADTTSQHNLVVWSKAGVDTLAIDSVVIYREITTNNYGRIGSASIHGFTQYMDMTSNPNNESYFYEIGLWDTCGTSSLSTPVETILLQSMRGIGNVVDLSWNLYQGNTVDDYRILRDDSGTGNWHVIDSVPGNIGAYTDSHAPSSPKLRYMLNTAWSLSCTPYLPIMMKHGALSSHFKFNTNNQSYSNITNVVVTGIDQLISASDVDVYPNPVKDELSITLHANIDGTATITNVLGQNVYTTKLTGNSGSTQKINTSGLTQGVYFLKIESNGQVLTKKVLKM
jgi:hypothetical protein